MTSRVKPDPAQRGLSDRPDRDIGVAPQAALFHVPVVHAQPNERVAQVLEERRGVARRAQVRLGDDLDERNAGAIVVDVRPLGGIGEPFVQRLAGVLFHVHARDADACALGTLQLDEAGRRQRLVVLRDLIALRKVRIEVVLPREDRPRVDAAAQRERGARGQIDRPPVQHRQRARQPEADGTDVRVRRRPEARGTPAEDFGLGEELRVDLEPDDGFVRHGLR